MACHGLGRVLDLGCGSGRDCYVAAGLVGEHGSVVGVDMTEVGMVLAEPLRGPGWQGCEGWWEG